MIERQIQHVTRLVDELLDVTRIARGKIQLRFVRINLVDLVRRTAEDESSVFKTLDVVLATNVPDEPIWVVVDPTRIAQMIGNDIPSLVRTARELQEYPIIAVDLNLGCPAPVVYRKCAGGGLLREPQKVDAILDALREAVSIKFTVKTRIGFDSSDVFSELLPIFAKHSLDLLTVHGRTVKEMYRTEVHYDFIRLAVKEINCPVLANGNVYSAEKAKEVLEFTGARGLSW